MDLPTLVKQLCIHLRATEEYAKSNKTKSQQVKRVSSVLDFCTWLFESFANAGGFGGGFMKIEGNARSLLEFDQVDSARSVRSI